jgi:phosphohistidine phosphatase
MTAARARTHDILGEDVDAVVFQGYLHDAFDDGRAVPALEQPCVLEQRSMKVLLIRHAPAVRTGTGGIRDHDRPLTPRGHRRFREAARGLARIADRPDILLTSPLTRARATAEIAAAAFRRVTPRIEPALGHDDVDVLVTVLKRYRPDATVALVGHEPTLSGLLAHLLGMHQGDDRFAFKKGGAALVHLPDGPSMPGQLRWFVKPRILRLVGSR